MHLLRYIIVYRAIYVMIYSESDRLGSIRHDIQVHDVAPAMDLEATEYGAISKMTVGVSGQRKYL